MCSGAEAADTDKEDQQNSATLSGNSSGEVPSVLKCRIEVVLQNSAFTEQIGSGSGSGGQSIFSGIN